jgi:hypothetical protein
MNACQVGCRGSKSRPRPRLRYSGVKRNSVSSSGRIWICATCRANCTISSMNARENLKVAGGRRHRAGSRPGGSPRGAVDGIPHHGHAGILPEAGPLVREAGLLHHPASGGVGRGGDTDDPGQAVLLEAEAQRRQGAFGREAAAPSGSMQLEADLDPVVARASHRDRRGRACRSSDQSSCRWPPTGRSRSPATVARYRRRAWRFGPATCPARP